MAYNNPFPVGYQPMQFYPNYQNPYQQQFVQPQMQQQPMQQTMQQQSAPSMTPPTVHADIVQVENRDSAERYPVAAGASQMMISRDETMIFVKTANASGYALDVFVKQKPEPKKPEINLSDYVTREEFEARLADVRKAREETPEA